MPANPIQEEDRVEGVGTREGLIGTCVAVKTSGFGHHFAEIMVQNGSQSPYSEIGSKVWCRSEDLQKQK